MKICRRCKLKWDDGHNTCDCCGDNLVVKKKSEGLQANRVWEFSCWIGDSPTKLICCGDKELLEQVRKSLDAIEITVVYQHSEGTK